MTTAPEWKEGPIPHELHMVLALMKNGRIKVVFKKGVATNKDGSPCWVDDDLSFISFYTGRIVMYDPETPHGRRAQEGIDKNTEQNTYTHWLPVPPPPGGWEEWVSLAGESRQAWLAANRRWEKMRRRD